MPTTPVHVCLAVWGAHHTEVFLRYALPTHLAPGNLPTLAASTAVTYHIYASRDAMGRMTPNPAFRRLRELARVHLRALPSELDRLDPNVVDSIGAYVKYGTINRCYVQALEAIDRTERPFLVFGAADLVYSDRAFSSWYERLHRDADVVLTTSLSLELDGAGAELESRYGRRSDRSIAVSARDLVALTQAHPHPFIKLHCWDIGSCTDCVSFLYWPVVDRGWIIRGFQLHPAMMRIGSHTAYDGKFTVDTNFPMEAVPERARRIVLQDSDDGLFVELSMAGYMRAMAGPHPWTAPRFAEMLGAFRQWGQFVDMSEHLAMAHRPIRFHRDELDSDWTAVETASDRVIDDIERHLEG
jgi:hypothetical protein